MAACPNAAQDVRKGPIRSWLQPEAKLNISCTRFPAVTICLLSGFPWIFYENQEATIRILLVEDDPELARRLSDGLRSEGYVVEHAANGEMGLGLGREENYDAAILDLGLPDMQGVEVLRQWPKLTRHMPV